VVLVEEDDVVLVEEVDVLEVVDAIFIIAQYLFQLYTCVLICILTARSCSCG
jgi:hypothetical protein